MTFLAVLAHEAVALPISHSFPASEIRYLLENSEAKLVLSAPQFAAKADQVLKEGISYQPVLSITVDSERGSGEEDEDILVNGASSGQGGFMLYTSGTTSKPVSHIRISTGERLQR